MWSIMGDLWLSMEVCDDTICFSVDTSWLIWLPLNMITSEYL